MAQLQAELELERQNSAATVAEKLALREHLSGIVSRLRPRLAAAGRGGPSDPPADIPVPLQEIRDAEDIIEQTSDYGGSRKASAEYSRTASLDAWGPSGAASVRESMTAATPHNSLATDLLDKHSFRRGTQQNAAGALDEKQRDSSEGPNIPDTPAKHA